MFLIVAKVVERTESQGYQTRETTVSFLEHPTALAGLIQSAMAIEDQLRG